MLQHRCTLSWRAPSLAGVDHAMQERYEHLGQQRRADIRSKHALSLAAEKQRIEPFHIEPQVVLLAHVHRVAGGQERDQFSLGQVRVNQLTQRGQGLFGDQRAAVVEDLHERVFGVLFELAIEVVSGTAVTVQGCPADACQHRQLAHGCSGAQGDSGIEDIHQLGGKR